MEEEARIILREAVNDNSKSKEGLGTRLAKHFAGKVPKEFKAVETREPVRIPNFEE
jgi:hypothetical protein